MTIQQEMESQQKIPPLFDGSASWFKYEELIEDWLDLAVLEETKRGRIDLSETQKCIKDYFTEILQEQPMESSVSGIR